MNTHPSSGKEEDFHLGFVIVANGIIRFPEEDKRHIQTDDVIIAADGGLSNCQVLGVHPDVLIGDLDSVSESDLSVLQERRCEILSFPSRKDETDLELAILHAVERDAKTLVILGALGARWDQTLTNLLVGFHPAVPELSIKIVDGPHQISYIHPTRPTLLQGQKGDIVSLIPLMGDAKGIQSTGLEYELRHGLLVFGRSRGISNTLVQKHARIEVSQGSLICIHTSQLNQYGGGA